MGVKGALLRYRVMAYVTGVVLATAFIWLIVGRLFLDYVDPEARPALYGYLWIAHGWLYFLYLITGVDLAFRVRYSVWRTLAIPIAATSHSARLGAMIITRSPAWMPEAISARPNCWRRASNWTKLILVAPSSISGASP